MVPTPDTEVQQIQSSTDTFITLTPHDNQADPLSNCKRNKREHYDGHCSLAHQQMVHRMPHLAHLIGPYDPYCLKTDVESENQFGKEIKSTCTSRWKASFDASFGGGGGFSQHETHSQHVMHLIFMTKSERLHRSKSYTIHRWIRNSHLVVPLENMYQQQWKNTAKSEKSSFSFLDVNCPLAEKNKDIGEWKRNSVFEILKIQYFVPTT